MSRSYRHEISLVVGVSATQAMALPPSLRNSITPPELELIASEELVEIIPLISMERTAFISVRPALPRALTVVL